MKKLTLTIALAAGMALPMAATSTVKADPDYTVMHTGRSHVTLWQHSFGRGNERCSIPAGSTVNRHWGENWDEWIYVKVTHIDGHWLRYLNEQSCRGWISKKFLAVRGQEHNWVPRPDRQEASNQSNNDRVSQPGNQNAGFVEMGTVRNSKWGKTIPIFKDRGTFFKARHSLNKNGHYNGQEGKVVCKVPLNYAVEFKQFKNWGVGEVKAWYKKRCIGWMDAGAVRNW